MEAEGTLQIRSPAKQRKMMNFFFEKHSENFPKGSEQMKKTFVQKYLLV